MPITIEYLAHVPEHIPTLAQITFDTWSKYDPSLTIEDSLVHIKSRLNTDKVPLTLVALDNDNLIGMANLKSTTKLSGYEDRNLWLGSFWVAEQYKDHQVGEMLLDAIVSKAQDLGYEKISVWESNPEDAAWHLKHGWSKFALDTYQNHPVTLLEYKLKN
jgi:N-acetylglutamate synthase-like GNAT family acetyltransferase